MTAPAIAPSGAFSRDAWDRNADLYETIRTMPFNQDLAAGTLRQDRFQQYIIQDGHYLIAYARALAIAGAKADTPDGIIQFSAGAQTALLVEKALHETYYARFGVDHATFERTPLSPTCHHYCTFLVSLAYADPYPAVLAGLLPCFWVYAEIGKDILANAAPDNPYQDWIDTYAGQEFEDAVRAAIAATDRAADQSSDVVRARMHTAYTRATELEWMFWDSAYRLEQWPV